MLLKFLLDLLNLLNSSGEELNANKFFVKVPIPSFFLL